MPRHTIILTTHFILLYPFTKKNLHNRHVHLPTMPHVILIIFTGQAEVIIIKLSELGYRSIVGTHLRLYILSVYNHNDTFNSTVVVLKYYLFQKKTVFLIFNI